jgi:hypothetical protein
MAYTINRTDGTVVATITDGTLNNSTSLTLFGKSYSGFGEALNENLVKLLENSSSSSAPVAPLPGELWFDTASKSIKVYDGTGFKPTGGARAQGTQPTSSSAGDLWLDTDDNQVYAYTGSAWKLVGPVYSDSQQLSGWKVEDIGYSGGSHTVSSMYANNVRVAILSRNTFTPNNTSETSNGFAQINAGITLNSTLSAQLTGNTSSASALDVSSTSNTSANVIAGGNFLRADASDITTGSLQINNDSGVIVGPTPSSDSIEIYRSSGHAIIENKAQDKDLSIKIKDGSTVKTPIAITGTTGNIALTGDVTITGNLNITGEYNSSSSTVVTYDDVFLRVNNGNGSDADGGLVVEKASGDARIFWDASEGHWAAGASTGTYSQVIRLEDAKEDGDANKGKVLKTTAGGNVKVTSATLGAVGSISSTDTSNANVPTIGAVATFGNLWGGSAKRVETTAPSSGDGNNGDFWFVREA